MKVVHEWLKDYVGEKIPSASDIEQLLTFHSFEIEGVSNVAGHEVIEVKVLPNRSSDCLSHRGIAREIATLLGVSLKYDPFTEDLSLQTNPSIVASVDDTVLCPYFNIVAINDITVGPSPDWLQKRLEALGQRSINNVVDATNYIMLGLGQPLHAYDADKLSNDSDGRIHIGTRLANEGEIIETLDGEERTLTSSMQLIVDKTTNEPIGLAGVKGGQRAAIEATTKNIIIEAGIFDPVRTRQTAQLLRLTTDASKRYENNLVPQIAPYGLTAVVALITKIAGGTSEGYAHERIPETKQVPVTLREKRIKDILSISVDSKQIGKIFDNLGFFHENNNGEWNVVPSFERTDITIEEDLIEEIGRVVGYDSISSVLPTTLEVSSINPRHYYSELIRTHLVSMGFSEIITSTFRKKDEIQLKNALASDKSFVRSTLTPGIITTLDKNIHFCEQLGIPDVRVFELGTVFKKKDATIVESMAVAIGVRVKKNGYSGKEDTLLNEIKQSLETLLGRSFEYTYLQGVLEFSLSELIPELSVPKTYEPPPSEMNVMYTPFSQFPAIVRDIALWVPKAVSDVEVAAQLRIKAGELCTRIDLFDTFSKEDQISYGFRLIFQSFDRTLTDREVNEIMEIIQTSVEENGYIVR